MEYDVVIILVICGGVCLLLLALILSLLILVKDEAITKKKIIVLQIKKSKKKCKPQFKKVDTKIKKEKKLVQSNSIPINQTEINNDISWESIFTVHPLPPPPPLPNKVISIISNNKLCKRCHKFNAKVSCQYSYCVNCCRGRWDSVCKAHGTGYQHALNIVNDAMKHGGYHEVDISFCNLKKCPPGLTSIGHHTATLNLSTNKLTSIPDDIGTLHQLEELFLQYNQLTILPNSLCNLSQLYELDIKNNNLKYLPTDIGHLTGLNILCLTKNRLTFLPHSIGKLSKLQELILHSNKLSCLPDELCSLTKLKYLYCGENKLQYLPDQFGKLVNLEELDLEGCQLVTLPESFRWCQSLNKVWLSNNKLIKLPVHIGWLKNLKELHLRKNNIKMFPVSIKELNLQTFTAQHNPIFVKEQIHKFNYTPPLSFPSLLELSGRAVILMNIQWKHEPLPHHLTDMLSHCGICSSCGGPFLTYYSCSVHFSQIGVFYRLPLYEHNCSPHYKIPCYMKQGVG